jgi:hypothetical protein
MQNNGIHIEGQSTVNVGAMSAGTGAVAVNAPVYGLTLADVRELLRDLERKVSVAPPDSSGRSVADAREAVKEARAEAATEAPDKGRLMSFLERARVGAGATAEVAAAVTAVETALQAVL